MKLKSPLILLVLTLIISTVAASAQNTKTAPYTAGEVLTYEGKVSKAIIRGISVAEVTFSVVNTPDGKNYVMNADAVSKGSLLRLFGFKFLQKISSTVDGQNLNVLRTVKRDEQGDRVRDSEATFNYQDKTVSYVETDPNDTARPPRRIASTIVPETNDLVSAIYALRRLPLAVGKKFALNVSDSGLVYKVPVSVTARELQDTSIGKIICFVIEPDVFGEGRMIEQKGSMKIWITDDARRLPVRAQINTNIGRVEVKLRRAPTTKQAGA